MHALARRLEQAALPGVEECVLAYTALIVYYDPLLLSAAKVQGRVQACLEGLDELPAVASRRVEIPTVYDGEY
ncbi:MAG: carboxyltransferase domain-containing protein, partial [Chloroflexi bacterium]|nr:carboxyltransferase domain-containing protein [Chloroflexota bacterium]